MTRYEPDSERRNGQGDWLKPISGASCFRRLSAIGAHADALWYSSRAADSHRLPSTSPLRNRIGVAVEAECQLEAVQLFRSRQDRKGSRYLVAALKSATTSSNAHE